MRTLLSLLWTDQLGSTLSTEMALVTSITVGALSMGMAEFNTTVNREFQNSARVSALMEEEETSQEEDTAAKKKKTDAETDEDENENEKTKSEWRSRRTEDRKESAE